MIAARRGRLHPTKESWVLGHLKGREMVLEIRMEISIEPRRAADSRESGVPVCTEGGFHQPCDIEIEDGAFRLEPEVSEGKTDGFLAAQLDRVRARLSTRIQRSFRILKVRAVRLARSFPEKMRRAALKWPGIILQLGQGLF
jgi:hypothetical protein